jgi:hypothetical protein
LLLRADNRVAVAFACHDCTAVHTASVTKAFSCMVMPHQTGCTRNQWVTVQDSTPVTRSRSTFQRLCKHAEAKIMP